MTPQLLAMLSGFRPPTPLLRPDAGPVELNPPGVNIQDTLDWLEKARASGASKTPAGFPEPRPSLQPGTPSRATDLTDFRPQMAAMDAAEKGVPAGPAVQMPPPSPRMEGEQGGSWDEMLKSIASRGAPAAPNIPAEAMPEPKAVPPSDFRQTFQVGDQSPTFADFSSQPTGGMKLTALSNPYFNVIPQAGTFLRQDLVGPGQDFLKAAETASHGGTPAQFGDSQIMNTMKMLNPSFGRIESPLTPDETRAHALGMLAHQSNEAMRQGLLPGAGGFVPNPIQAGHLSNEAMKTASAHALALSQMNREDRRAMAGAKSNILSTPGISEAQIASRTPQIEELFHNVMGQGLAPSAGAAPAPAASPNVTNYPSLRSKIGDNIFDLIAAKEAETGKPKMPVKDFFAEAYKHNNLNPGYLSNPDVLSALKQYSEAQYGPGDVAQYITGNPMVETPYTLFGWINKMLTGNESQAQPYYARKFFSEKYKK